MEELAVLIEKSHAGEKEAREVLVEKNLGLVHHIVKRFLGRGYDAEDLFQIGTIGLIKAIDKFDTSYEVKFSTYAVPMISGEIKRFLRDDGMIKVSRSVKENGFKVKQAAERLFREKGKEASLEDLVKETGLMPEDIVLALEAGAEVESIYKTMYQSDGSEIFLIDKLSEANKTVVGRVGNSSVPEDYEKEKLLNHLMLKQLMEGLKEEERELIRLRYFKDKTQVEVANELGISQVQVSRLEKKILLSMRSKCE